MDPNEALRLVRAHAKQVRVEDETREDGWIGRLVQQGRDLTEAFDALDEWLSRDGFPPADWRSHDEKDAVAVLRQHLKDVGAHPEAVGLRRAIELIEHYAPNEAVCRHCQRRIILVNERWICPEAGFDDEDGDGIWRETCDANDTFDAVHEPEGS